MADPDFQEELERIHRLPLAEFITARNELAKKLRASSDHQAADEVKAQVKPSLTAWAVNALYHHERERFDELLQAAAAVRAALAGKGDRRKADAERRKALQALLARAAKILVEAGPATTLPPGSAKRPGKKTSAGAAAAAVRQDRIEAARQKVDERQTALAQLERDVEVAEDTADDAGERHERLAEEAAEAEQRARAATEAAAAARKDMVAANAAVTKARAARGRGLSRLETARRQLERCKG